MALRVKVRFYVPIIVVLAIMGIVATVVHWKANSEDRDTLEFGAAVVGGITAIYGLLLSVQSARNTAARKFLERWTDPQFAEYRQAISKVVHGKPEALAGFDRQKLVAILNFWEEMAIAVHRGEADEEILRDFFYTPAVQCYRVAKDWINSTRKDLNQPTAYIQYEKLYNKWEAK